jgi:hypothetical protein
MKGLEGEEEGTGGKSREGSISIKSKMTVTKKIIPSGQFPLL